jgi:chromosome segregation ATPase
LEASQAQLQAQQQSARAEQARLEARSQELQAAHADVLQQAQGLTETLAGETRRRESVERQTSEISQHRAELETALAENKQAQARLQHDLEVSQTQLQAQRATSRSEQTRLEARANELEAAQADLWQQVKRLTETLGAETTRREDAERQTSEIGQRRSELEAELAQNKQAQARLQQDLGVSKAHLQAQRENYLAEQSKVEARTKELQALTTELAAVRNGIEQETLQRQKLAEKVVEVERARSELATRANAACDLVKTRENSIRALESQVRKQQAEVNRLESLLQSEIDQCRREQAQAEALEKQTAELSEQLAGKVAEQQRWLQREAELEQFVRTQKDQLANSAAAATIQEVELGSLKKTADDLRVIQAALCTQVRDLTTQNSAASERIHELVVQSQAATRTIQARDQQLAALRHAILDAARIGSNISRERLQVDCQVVDGWKQLINALLHTPLSMAQRGLVSQITCALDGWRKGRPDATNGVEFQVEPPNLQPSEFNCAELIESVLAAIRKNADETGAKIQTALVGPMPGRVYGNARHIHELITLLAASLPETGRAENLEISFEAVQNGTAGLQLSFLLSPTGSAESRCDRLAAVTRASGTLQAASRDGSELALAAGWQLALALGGEPSLEPTADQKVLVRIFLPLLAV